MRHALPIAAALLAIPASAQAFESQIATMVPMRDGIHLATDVYVPSSAGPHPTVLIRTTYGTDFVPAEAAKLVCDGLGFALVVQDTRGRYESEGVDDVFMSDGWGEHQDGYDTIDWIVSQSWSDDQVGIFGVSALGITSYMAMGALHPSLKAAHVGLAPWIFFDTVYPGGTFRKHLLENWLEGQDASYMLETYREHPMYDPLWGSLDMRAREAEITIPVFHWGGWHDIFAEGPVQGFSVLQGGGVTGNTGEQHLIMGPWTHIDAGAFSPRQGELTYPKDSIYPLNQGNPFDFFKEHLQGKGSSTGRGKDWPVRFFVMGDPDSKESGSNVWETAQSWPIPTDIRPLFLQTDGSMSWTAPADIADPVSYRYDPANPSPTIGGRELFLDAGPRDQRPLIGRSDVVVFETAPLDRSVKVVGELEAVLFAASDAPDTDFVVRLNDVYPDGRAMLVADNVFKARYRNSMSQPELLTPGEIAEIVVNLHVTAQVFGKGHKIQVMVSSSNYPRFELARNTGDDIWGDDPPVVATNSIFADSLRPSHLLLPIPRTGATRRAAPNVAPSAKVIAEAKARLQRGAKLTPVQQDALRYEAGRMMMQGMLEQI